MYIGWGQGFSTAAIYCKSIWNCLGSLVGKLSVEVQFFIYSKVKKGKILFWIFMILTFNWFNILMCFFLFWLLTASVILFFDDSNRFANDYIMITVFISQKILKQLFSNHPKQRNGLKKGLKSSLIILL